MWPDRVSNPGPLTYESVALPIALRGPVPHRETDNKIISNAFEYNWLCFVKKYEYTAMFLRDFVKGRQIL